jgi:hypothetical protein
MREVVLVVHTQPGRALPVLVDGKLSSMTTSDGLAHVLLRIDRSVRTLNAKLDTGTAPKLRPKSPSRTFDLSGNDAILIFDQNFSTRLVAPISKEPPKPQRHVPERVG